MKGVRTATPATAVSFSERYWLYAPFHCGAFRHRPVRAGVSGSYRFSIFHLTDTDKTDIDIQYTEMDNHVKANRNVARLADRLCPAANPHRR
jgi:hypothetical protein